MNKQAILPTVEQLIANSKFEEVLELLSAYSKGKDKQIENHLLMQTASFNRNSREHQMGLLTKPQYDMVLAKLADSLNYIIDRLPAKGNAINKDKLIETSSTEPTNQKRKILFLTANPKNPEGPALRIGSEMQAIKEALRGSSDRDLFELNFEPAVRIPTITRAMREYKPQIVHFSGHGYGEGIAVEDVNGEIVYFPTKGLDMLFSICKDDVECVLLNACYSSEQAKVISVYNIHVIGMSDEIDDDVAKKFAVGFYQGLGAGDPPEISFKLALINISSEFDSAHLPELWYNGEKISK